MTMIIFATKIPLYYSGDFMGMAKDVLGKPFGFLPFLRFFPPYRQRFLSLSQSLKGKNKILSILFHNLATFF